MSTREEDDRFIYGPGDLQMSQCDGCKHCKSGAICDAFPDGIPDAIMLNKISHKKPYPGDHGIQFAPYNQQKEEYHGEKR